MDFTEGIGTNYLLRHAPVLPVWGDKGCDHDEAGHVHQLGDLGNTSNIFRPCFWREAEILVQAMANVVAVQNEAGMALQQQMLFQGEGQGRFAGTAQAGHP
ncbi:hypothetical protein D9M68_881760 [compost metagenome]